MITVTAAPTTTNAPALDLPMVAPTCPACDSHNVSDADRGVCGDCGLTDNLSAFMGGGMTANATFAPSKFANSGLATGAANKVRAFTIHGNVD
jgi:hypothetical protein